MTQGLVDYDWKADRVGIQGTTAHLILAEINEGDTQEDVNEDLDEAA